MLGLAPPKPAGERSRAAGRALFFEGIPAPILCRLCEERQGAQRRTAEQFIHRKFAETFGADVQAFLPRLFSLRLHDGDRLAAFGIQPAGESPRLFLETYLDHPIEHVLSAATGREISRSAIVEVGNFAASPGNTRLMIVTLTAFLQREGFAWVAFTGLPLLRNAFNRLGLAPVSLCPADRNRLPEEERSRWNRYYDHAPTVMAGDIDSGLDTLLDSPGIAALLKHVRFPRKDAQ